MAKYQKEHEGANGWSRWIPPVMRGYKMACCDCGLVHDVQFKVLRVTKTLRDGRFVAEDVKTKKLRVKLRARRNNRATAAMRRKKTKRKTTNPDKQS